MALPFLQLRAAALAGVRDFFRARDVLEVETPCLESTPTSDPHIEPIIAGERYLRSSPEFAMKRLLAAGSGDIYQISKVFRAQEIGALHNPEFTMLEWYRCRWDYRRLMDETDQLLRRLFGLRRGLPTSQFISYREAFQQTWELDPWQDDTAQFVGKAHALGFAACHERIEALDFLMAAIARTHLAKDRLSFVSDYPPEQAQLARVTGQVAERFEVYFGAVELANGYTELTDARECRRRFECDNERLEEAGKPVRAVSEALLAALEVGLPECAGVSLGIDRTLMCLAEAECVTETLTFGWDDA